MRSDFEERINQVISCVDTNSKAIKGKIQNDLNVCVGKIRVMNNECIQQVRKMNDLGAQPITNMSNHYTDTDSHTGYKNPIQYLSEAPIKDHKKDSYYMSEDQPNDNNNDNNDNNDNNNNDNQLILETQPNKDNELNLEPNENNDISNLTNLLQKK